MLIRPLWKKTQRIQYQQLLIRRNFIKAKHLIRDLTFLRHARSQYNVASQQYLDQNKITNLSWDQICQIQDFNTKINFNSKFIDCDLSTQGAHQCYQLKQKYDRSHFDYDLILVSPLLRALRTCRYIFHYYHIPKIVLPELTQAFRYSCDISKPILQKIEQFKDFDFSLIHQSGDLWFLDQQSEQTKALFNKRIKQKNINDYKNFQKLILQLMLEGRIYESDYYVRLRAKRVKQKLQQYKQKYPKILVISHHYMIQNLIATGYMMNHQPITQSRDQIPNARPFSTSFHQIIDVE